MGGREGEITRWGGMGPARGHGQADGTSLYLIKDRTLYLIKASNTLR